MTEDARRLETAPDADRTAETHALVQDYYGRAVSRSDDLRTDACATAAAPDARLKRLIGNLHPETRERYFGCGLIAPEAVEGARVLDLGCGAGRDVYVLAQLVGPDGFVDGVDMTPEQLEAAERRKLWHMAQFGYDRPNVAFHQGYLERLGDLALAPAGYDVAVSNCVVNLAADKRAALAGLRRLLKKGGEFYFSDVYADAPLPDRLRRDPVIYGECLGGAMDWRSFESLALETGFARPRLVSASPLSLTDPEIAATLDGFRFVSATYRLFAAEVGDLARRELWTARYRGGADGAERRLDLDHAHRFEAGTALTVDGETAAALSQSRFAPFFDFAPAEPGAEAPTPAASPFALAERAPAAASGCCG